MKIRRPNPQSLIVTKSRLSNFGRLALLIVFFCVWNFFLLGSKGTETYNLIKFLCMLLSLILLPAIYQSLKIVVVGERFSFDGVQRTILKNQKSLARFGEVAHLQIKTIGPSGDVPETHHLSVVLESGKKIEIHNSNPDGEINLGDWKA